MVKTYPVPCTKEEIDAIILAAVDNDFAYTLFMVAKTTGRRLGEYYDVKVKDINIEDGTMMTKVLKRKRKIDREAILTPEIASLLQRYILRNKLKLDDYVFRKVGYRQIQNLIKVYSKKAKVNHNVSFHNFRHYFVTELFKMGWSYDKIAKLTGHTTPGTLISYDHSVASDIKEDALIALKNM